MLRIILLTPIESGTSTWKSLGSYCLFNCWPSVQVWVIKLIISPWFTTLNKTSAFVSVCCQLYCTIWSWRPLPIQYMNVQLLDISINVCFGIFQVSNISICDDDATINKKLPKELLLRYVIHMYSLWNCCYGML